jgi:hypothetical protein
MPVPENVGTLNPEMPSPSREELPDNVSENVEAPALTTSRKGMMVPFDYNNRASTDVEDSFDESENEDVRSPTKKHTRAQSLDSRGTDPRNTK